MVAMAIPTLLVNLVFVISGLVSVLVEGRCWPHLIRASLGTPNELQKQLCLWRVATLVAIPNPLPN